MRNSKALYYRSLVEMSKCIKPRLRYVHGPEQQIFRISYVRQMF